jgi:hypothetical protein
MAKGVRVFKNGNGVVIVVCHIPGKILSPEKIAPTADQLCYVYRLKEIWIVPFLVREGPDLSCDRIAVTQIGKVPACFLDML